MKEPLPLGYGLAVAWSFITVLTFHFAIGAFASARPAVVTDVVTTGALEALVFVSGMIVLLRLHGTDAPLSHQVGLRATHPALGFIGLALGVALHFPAESLRQVAEWISPTPSEVLAQRAALLEGSTPLRVAMVLAFAGCVGPLVEELFFRGALFGALRRTHAVVGSTLVTAVAFVMSHLDPRLWLPLLLVSAVLGYLRAASGSLLPGLALHVAFNTVSVVALASGLSSISTPEDVPIKELLPGWAATAILLFAGARLSATDDARAARALDG